MCGHLKHPDMWESFSSPIKQVLFCELRRENIVGRVANGDLVWEVVYGVRIVLTFLQRVEREVLRS